jgi:hypothetical protein
MINQYGRPRPTSAIQRHFRLLRSWNSHWCLSATRILTHHEHAISRSCARELCCKFDICVRNHCGVAEGQMKLVQWSHILGVHTISTTGRSIIPLVIGIASSVLAVQQIILSWIKHVCILGSLLPLAVQVARVIYLKIIASRFGGLPSLGFSLGSVTRELISAP